MAIEWKEFFDDLVADKSWKALSKEIKDRGYDLVAKWVGGDRKTVVDAVKAALQDDKLSSREIIGVLSVVALDWTENNSELGQSFAKDLLVNLRDGELTATEIADVAANWAATSLTENETLRDLIKTGVAGKLETDAVKQALLKWLEERAGVPGLKDRIAAILKSAKPVNLRSLVLISSAYLIAQGKLKKAGDTEEGRLKSLIGALDALGKSSLSKAFDALADEDYPEAAKLVLDELGLDDDHGIAKLLLKMVFAQKADDAIHEFLAGAIKRKLSGPIDDKKAGALAGAILEVLKGKRDLIPRQTERQLYAEEYGFDTRYYELWTEVRKILYAAKLAVNAGPLVPTDPMARPHVFAAAAISPETRIDTMFPEDQWPPLLQRIAQFSAVTFGHRPNGEQFLKESPVNRDMMVNGVTALRMHRNIRIVLFQ